MGRRGIRTRTAESRKGAGSAPLIGSDAKTFLDRLDPAAYEPGDLVELGLDDTEARYAMAETLSLLRDTIARLSADEVLVLTVG